MMFISLKNRTKGFTLIELLVVIAIIGILSSVVLASLSTARAKSRDAKRISDLGQVQLALELYFDSAQSYPISAAAAPYVIPAALAPTYIPLVPVTPGGATAYQYLGLGTPAANIYPNCTVVTCNSYGLFAELERNDNTIVTTDTDTITSGVVIRGDSVACLVAAAAAGAGLERCYDIRP
ncbi:MAG: hypothetical protein A2845_01335 [Candidatus Lloydbacteria bacterium RIFCSPHIGHO2_01_FULL_49_22]|uniref:Type II secretion system protein GspG C-terminal domain-containing protein n=1 Tax=Candidatus Lloydbacteria bacterium RIFCSPHIGHO2_01_FULL_49_22 TaxID=1798658 RepID=A0A1G2CXE7_9BACT|nr:MAG: hypothetical protein A2845_01335 [Candidatus Lloydbacteria bacterium RIFCSPHIGHO2_01_FULL_49_22]OGZ09948.1 MAG: hypothetical protein A3C14_04505 [Candidatus Lloydbacteria bacterium RIFCSPHIGHO2_02_FULL_50_18]